MNTPVATDANWPFDVAALLAALDRNRVHRENAGLPAATPVVVAVADNGLDQIDGPQFPPGLFHRNALEIAANGIDDDRNDYRDDVVGMSLFMPTIPPGPAPDGKIAQREHGTLMASLAVGGPEFRARAPATADRIRLLVVNMVERRVESINGSNHERWSYPSKGLAEAIRFARRRGAAVLNLSLGTEQVVSEFETLARTEDDLVVVAAAGNRATQYRDVSFYPASYGGEATRIPGRFITVGASDRRGCLADFSGRGSQTVDILAPGVAIRAYSLGGQSVTLDGTSQATALTSFIVGIMKSEGLSTPQSIRDRLFATVDQRASLADHVASRGVLNPVRAVSVHHDIVRLRTATQDGFVRLNQMIRLADLCDDAAPNAAGHVLRIERVGGAKPLRVLWRKSNGPRTEFLCKPPNDAASFTLSDAAGATIRLADVALLIPR